MLKITPSRGALAAALVLLASAALGADYSSPTYKEVTIANSAGGSNRLVMKSVPTNALLKAISISSKGAGYLVYREGFSASGDGGAATYHLSASNCTAANDGTQVQPTLGIGCWIADASTPIMADLFGAVGDGTTDDRTAILNAANSLGANGGVVLLSCGKNYRIATNLTIPPNVTVKHCRGFGGASDTIAANSLPFHTQPHVNLDSTASITLSSNSGFSGTILRTGLTGQVPDPSSYAGTAFKLVAGGSADIKLDILAIGFSICVDGNGSSYSNRMQWRIECDANPPATQGAVIVPTSFDSSRIEIRTWPWGTAGYNHGVGGVNTRSGYGTQLIAEAAPNHDDSQFDIFDHGHSKGVVVGGSGNIHFHRVWCENNTDYGLQLDVGGAFQFDKLVLIKNKGMVFNAGTGVNIDMYFSNSQDVPDASSIIFHNPSANLHIGSWRVDKSTSYALNIGSNGPKITIDNARLVNVRGGAAPYIAVPASFPIEKLTISAIDTDLPEGTALIGGNQPVLTSIASAATVALPATGKRFKVTGTAAINNFNFNYNTREISLEFESTASLTTAGNIALRTGTTLQGAAGMTVDLVYNSTAAKWEERGRNYGTAALKNTGTSGNTVPLLDGANTASGQWTFSAAPIFSTLTGYLKGNGAGALTAAATVPSADFADGNSGTGSVLHATNSVANPSRLKLTDQGQCTMAAGTCAAQNLGTSYVTAPICFLTWTGTGTLAGALKVASTTTTVTPSSSDGADTAEVNWACFGN